MVPLYFPAVPKRFHLSKSPASLDAHFQFLSTFYFIYLFIFFELTMLENDASMRKIGKLLKIYPMSFKIFISMFFLMYPRRFFFAK